MYKIYQYLPVYRSSLESSMQQWQGYDEQYDALWSWLKETEAKLRSETGLKTQLAEKQRQRDTFLLIQTDVQAHEVGLESIKQQAEEIAKNNADTRVKNNAQQLYTRYKTLVGNEQVRLQWHFSFQCAWVKCCEGNEFLWYA